ncbi:hypothetical protein ACH5RR_034506 [Cinchona calisaya]|uniref:Late blight resistance protein homolog R1A-3 n=1 Tax=Cinchona calisaya TaxID=153742 RepID=A0ABD2YBR6_9GENT
MASVDPQDPLIHQEYKKDPDMKCDIRMLKFIISNLRPFVRFLFECQTEDQELEGRLKHADEVVQKVIQAVQLPLTDVYQGNEDWELSPTNVQLLVSNMNIVGRVACEIFSMECDVSKSRITLKSAEHLVTLMDSFLQNLKDAFVCRASTLVHIKKELRDMEERLMLLRNFLWFIEKNPIEQDNMKDVINSAQSLVVYTLRVSYICFMAKMDDKVVSDLKDVLSNTVEKIDTLQEEVNDICKEYLASLLVAVPDDSPTMDEQVMEFADYLIHKLRLLSDNKAPCFIVAAKDLIDFLIDELSSLRCNLMDHLQLQNPIKEMKSLIISTQALIFRTGLFISYMHRDTKEDEEMTEYCCAKLPDLLKGVDNLKQQASDLFNVFFSRRPWESDCPSTNVLECDNFLINKLEQLLHSEASPLYALKHQTEAVYEEIVSMRKLLCAIADLENPKMEFLLTRYKDIVHQAEYVIDSFIAGEGSIWCHRLGLFVVTKDVKILQKEVKAILTMTITCDTVIPSLYSGAPSQENNPPSTNATEGSKNEIHNRVEEAANKLVGLKDAEAEIIELLTGGSVQLKIVSIVGMPGLGKTSLANSVYKHPSVNLHFHVSAWCCVSQVYQKETLLFDIYDQIVGETNQSHETSQVDFVQKLYQNLKGRKFLIVIDDIWDIEAWYDLKQTFPDDENGSRILFTTRHRDVALRANSIPYALRLLSQEESCKLLWLKLFDKETCPPELSTISKFIAMNCEGLPLAVVLIAGILKGTERKEDCWELVAETSIKSQGTREKYFEILELSFKHLPACLKPCFLYFGTFPEDTTILASKLIKLWICEGFVQKLNLGQNS